VRTVNPSLLLLILVWVAILLPGALRSRLRPSPRATVGGFQRSMDGLRVQQSVAPPRRSSARREDPVITRRRRFALRMFVLTALALFAAPLLGGFAWVVAGLAVAATTVTVLVLRRLKLQRDAARTVLVSLDLRRPAQPLVDEITGELVVAVGSGASPVRLPSWRG
jgi:hypothetical protein